MAMLGLRSSHVPWPDGANSSILFLVCPSHFRTVKFTPFEFTETVLMSVDSGSVVVDPCLALSLC